MNEPKAKNFSLKVYIDLLNILSSICTITGISLLWVKTQSSIPIKSVVCAALTCLIGFTCFTFIISLLYYLYKNVEDELTAVSKPGLFMLAILCITILIIAYVKLCRIYLFDIIFNLL